MERLWRGWCACEEHSGGGVWGVRCKQSHPNGRVNAHAHMEGVDSEFTWCKSAASNERFLFFELKFCKFCNERMNCHFVMFFVFVFCNSNFDCQDKH